MRKEQVLIVPTNYVSHIGNGFVGTSSISTDDSYTLYDSTGVYKPLYEIEKKICLIRISVFLLIKNKENKYLVKELKDKSQKPYLELGINSYVKSYSGNYRALYNQISYLQNSYFKETPIENLKFIGNIRDFANTSVQSILGCIYYTEVDDCTCEKHELYEYKWYTVKELINKYNKATSWSKIIIDKLVDKTLEKYL